MSCRGCATTYDGYPGKCVGACKTCCFCGRELGGSQVDTVDTLARYVREIDDLRGTIENLVVAAETVVRKSDAEVVASRAKSLASLASADVSVEEAERYLGPIVFDAALDPLRVAVAAARTVG